MIPLLSLQPRRAMAIKVSQVNKDPEPAKLLQAFKAADKPFVVGARISGMFKSAFPDGPPKDKIRDEIREARIKEGRKGSGHAKTSQGIREARQHDRRRRYRIFWPTVFWVRVQDFFGQSVPVPIANNADLLIKRPSIIWRERHR